MIRRIFVFGSNEAGIHGAGAAKTAYQEHGARWGEGIGAWGHSYGIPTKDHNIQTLPMDKIESYVLDFIGYAKMFREKEFQVTRIGCGLAGFRDEDIAPLFMDAPENCYFDLRWRDWYPTHPFWGTF